MKQINLVFITLAIFSILLISYGESMDKGTNIDDGITLFVNGDYVSMGGAWDKACDNETWDGVLQNDCYGQPDNCVVVCGSSLVSPEYANFKYNINNGYSADYYENGNGQSFLPLKTGPSNDLINGLKKIVKVPAGSNQYALVDVI